jgi:hypothetical protein
VGTDIVERPTFDLAFSLESETVAAVPEPGPSPWPGWA